MYYPGALMRQSGPYIETDFFIHWFIHCDDILTRLSGLLIKGVVLHDVLICEEENLFLLSRMR
jgi:hypothetical protein